MNVSKELRSSAQVLYGLLLLNYFYWMIAPPGRLAGMIFLVLYLAGCLQILAQYRLTWPLIIWSVLIAAVILTSASGAWDARSIWLFHAKKIFIDNSLYAQLDNYGNSHSDYPIIVPALSATLAKIIGHWNEVFPKLSTLFFLIPPLLVICNLLHNTTLNLLFLLGLGLVARVHLVDGYMDAILAIYIATALIGFSELAKLKNTAGSAGFGGFVLVALPLMILPLIKNEGIFACMILLIAAGMTYPYLRNKAILLGLLAVALYMITWKWPTIAAHLHNDFLDGNYLERFMSRAMSVHDWQILSGYIVRTCGLSVMAIVIMALVHRSAWNVYRFCLVFLSLYLGFMVMVYLVTPLEFEFHLITSVDRTLMPINLVALLVGIYSLRGINLVWIGKIDQLITQQSVLIKIGLQGLAVLAIFGMVFGYLKTPIELNQTLSFAKHGNGVSFLKGVDDNAKEGWAHPEGWGVWMLGNQATLTLPKPNFPSAKTLELVVQPFQHPGQASQELGVYLNGQHYQFRVDKPQFMLTIPLGVTYPWQPTLELQFETSSAHKPSDLGLSSDHRLLSIGLVSATYR